MTMLATPENVRFVDALVRRDFVSFITKTFHTLMPNASLLMNWHVYALAYHLELVRAGVIRRLIINLLPRSLKSITASVAFPAYVLGRDPTKRLLAISYNLDLARTHATPFRTIVNSPWYQRAFPLTRAERDTELEFVTAQNGFRRATSVDATLTGLGCDIALLDDPQSAIDAALPSGRQHTFDLVTPVHKVMRPILLFGVWFTVMVAPAPLSASLFHPRQGLITGRRTSCRYGRISQLGHARTNRSPN